MSSPPVPLRNRLHTSARRYLWASMAVSISATALFNIFYVWPKHRKYEEYYKNYDAYERMREICSYKYKYMHTCPSELAKVAEEKGRQIAPLE